MSEESTEATPAPAAATTPVFGSAATFTSSGFSCFSSGFSLSSNASPADADASGATASSADDDAADPEAECQAEFKPLVQLDEVQTKYGIDKYT